MSRFTVTVTRRLPEAVEARMRTLFDVRLREHDRPLTREALAAADCDVLVPTLSDKIDGALIAAFGPKLKLIASFGAGTDHIDLPAAKARGIAVTNTPDVLTQDTADIFLGLILSAARGLGEGERLLRAGAWTGWSPTNLLGSSLTGKTLAIVGMGRIGRALARRARACGMRIHYHNRRPLDAAAEAETDARWWPELDPLLAGAEVVALCCPYSQATHHLIDARRLALLKRDAFLINAARGAVVEEEALLDALEGGRIAGAGLDVYPKEPEVNPRFLALPNVTLLPHLGSATIEGRTAMGEKAIANILAWSRGEDLPDRVV
ncbi:MAG TPA: D-glycerate dehydrogenase [Allosphingosinicella sp.]|jgi:glyoxylate reductase